MRILPAKKSKGMAAGACHSLGVFSASAAGIWFLVAALSVIMGGCGGSGGGGGTGGSGGGNLSIPPVPTGLVATAGNAQVSLTWSASAGAASYNVQRSTTSGGPYTTITSPVTNSYVDTSVTNGTTYYYVVAAGNSAGQSANSAQVSATPMAPATIPPVPAGLVATAGNAQVSLTWNASAGATSYNVQRSTASTGPYTSIATPATDSYLDTTVTNGTAYFYEVAAVNSAGQSANSAPVSATPMAPPTAVMVTINTLANRHPISPYVYGGNFPNSVSDITDTGTTLVRWGGNASSTYNWQLGTYNADNDYYFEDFGFSEIGDSDSTKFIRDVLSAGSTPLMTMPMLAWAAQSAETPGTGGNGHWSFSVAKYGTQCAVDPYNSDAGDGLTGACSTSPTDLMDTDLNVDYVPLLDDESQNCTASSCVYRSDWATALAAAFNTVSSAPHFYNMDNEIDIWGGTHFDVHPLPTTEMELLSVYLQEANALKTWDPAAIRFGPVSCCWEYYWNPAAGSTDKSANGNVDFLPWWLNEVYWSDLIAGARSLDVFDIHAYTEDTTSGLTLAQQQALALRATRDWWDPTYTSEAWFGTNNVLSTDPLGTIPFRMPRLRALVNTIYPGTPLSATEWNFAFAGESDFSTALADADAYGILGRERLYAAARWEAPVSTNANYQALKLYTNYDGQHDGFGTTSVAAINNGNASLFSSYAALDSAGQTLYIMIINKDPQNSAQVQFTLSGFTPSTMTTYTLASASGGQFTTSSSSPGAWSSTQTFQPYTASLLVVSGSLPTNPSAEWDLNPESIMVPAGGTVTLQPKLTSGSGTVTLGSPQSDTGISLNVTGATVTSGQNGAIVVTAGATPGFYKFSVPGTDSAGVTQTQSGWVVVNYPAATLTKAGDQQTGGVGTTLSLSVTLAPGSSGGTATGAPIFFTTAAGSLTYNGTTGTMLIVPTNASGVASVTLTLPSQPGIVTVTATGPIGLGSPLAPFTETAQ